MDVVVGTARAVTGAGAAATATLGAVGGAAVGGLVGSVKGAAVGAAEGARRGSHSTPTAVLTLGAVALTGVVQWPIVAAVGGAAVVLDQLKLGTKQDEPRAGEQSTGPGATTDTGAKAGAISAAPAGTVAGAKTPAPAAKAVRGRRRSAKTPPSKAAPSSTP
jgi:hypothetical protein